MGLEQSVDSGDLHIPVCFSKKELQETVNAVMDDVMQKLGEAQPDFCAVLQTTETHTALKDDLLAYLQEFEPNQNPEWIEIKIRDLTQEWGVSLVSVIFVVQNGNGESMLPPDTIGPLVVNIIRISRDERARPILIGLKSPTFSQRELHILSPVLKARLFNPGQDLAAVNTSHMLQRAKTPTLRILKDFLLGVRVIGIDMKKLVQSKIPYLILPFSITGELRGLHEGLHEISTHYIGEVYSVRSKKSPESGPIRILTGR